MNNPNAEKIFATNVKNTNLINSILITIYDVAMRKLPPYVGSTILYINGKFMPGFVKGLEEIYQMVDRDIWAKRGVNISIEVSGITGSLLIAKASTMTVIDGCSYSRENTVWLGQVPGRNLKALWDLPQNKPLLPVDLTIAEIRAKRNTIKQMEENIKIIKSQLGDFASDNMDYR